MKKNFQANDDMPVIGIIGCGGSGNNNVVGAYEYMVKNNIIFRNVSVHFYCFNTDRQHLDMIEAKEYDGVQCYEIGPIVCEGEGAGNDPKIGYKAAKESVDDLQKVFDFCDIIMLVGVVGGGTGTGCLRFITDGGIKWTDEKLVLPFICMPPESDGPERAANAKFGTDYLNRCSSVFLINSDGVDDPVIMQNLAKAHRRITNQVIFDKINEIGITATIRVAKLFDEGGVVNTDAADIRSILKDGRNATLIYANTWDPSFGYTEGQNVAEWAQTVITDSPFMLTAIKDCPNGIINYSLRGMFADDYELKEGEEYPDFSSYMDIKNINLHLNQLGVTNKIHGIFNDAKSENNGVEIFIVAADNAMRPERKTPVQKISLDEPAW